MGNITLSVPESVHKEMKHFSEIKWSDIARRAIIERIETLKITEKITNKNKLTEEDIKNFSKKIKSLATKRFLEYK